MLHIQYLPLSGTIKYIGELKTIQRKTSSNLKKIVITIETLDGQILYPELRNKKVHLIKELKVGDFVKLDYSFCGSEKNGKRYNNIYINKLQKL